MSSLVYIKAFNEMLDKLFDFLLKVAPDIRSDILLTRTCTDFIRNANPRTPATQFMEFIGPYARQINDCDENFFLNFEQNLDVSSNNIMYGFKLKNVWTSNTITDIDKARIWMYFQKLLKLSEKVVNL
jgi:hypothetical protein